MRMTEERKLLLSEIVIGPVCFVCGILSLLTGYYPSKTSIPLSPLDSRIAGILLTTGSGILTLFFAFDVWKKRKGLPPR